MMTDNQFYALITSIGAGMAVIAAAIRFSVSRLIKALDENSKTMLENAKSNAVLSTKIDAISEFVHRTWEKELTPVHGTPVRGEYSKVRRKTEPGED